MTPAEIWGESSFHEAVRRGDAAAIDRALAAGAPLAAKDVLGFTPLHIAASEGNAAIVERLLSAGAEVDARAKQGLTPLMLACGRGHVGAVEWLLMARADWRLEAPPVWTLLSFLACARSLPVLERLIEAGFRVKEKEFTPYFRLVLELTGHRVKFMVHGTSRGIAGDTASVWAVDRPMTVPASLLAPIASDLPFATRTVQQARSFISNYYEEFEARAKEFDGLPNHEKIAPHRLFGSYLEKVHEVRCGRLNATEEAEGVSRSVLGSAVTTGDAVLVVALLRSAGWDPAQVTRESADDTLRLLDERGLWPVHADPLRKLAGAGL